jgi:hypothetical protein
VEQGKKKIVSKPLIASMDNGCKKKKSVLPSVLSLHRSAFFFHTFTQFYFLEK